MGAVVQERPAVGDSTVHVVQDVDQFAHVWVSLQDAKIVACQFKSDVASLHKQFY
jgi:hypothetical protein